MDKVLTTITSSKKVLGKPNVGLHNKAGMWDKHITKHKEIKRKY